MGTDEQVVLLIAELENGRPLATAATNAGTSQSPSRKWNCSGELPGTWGTRADPFEQHWADIEAFLVRNPGVQAKAVFECLQGEHAGQYRDGQLRFRRWRLENGPEREPFFEQEWQAGQQCRSDCTQMSRMARSPPRTLRQRPQWTTPACLFRASDGGSAPPSSPNTPLAANAIDSREVLIWLRVSRRPKNGRSRRRSPPVAVAQPRQATEPAWRSLRHRTATDRWDLRSVGTDFSPSRDELSVRRDEVRGKKPDLPHGAETHPSGVASLPEADPPRRAEGPRCAPDRSQAQHSHLYQGQGLT